MPVVCSKLALPTAAHSVVMRPRGISSGSQLLVFLIDEIREVEVSDGYFAAGIKTIRLSEHRLPVAGTFGVVTAAVYEPTSNSIFFVDSMKCIKRLDRDNNISLVAGNVEEPGIVDGRSTEARFECICALAADGKGNVFVAEEGAEKSCIRLVRVSTGEVVTLRGSHLPRDDGRWGALSYDEAAGALVAATATTVCHVLVYGSENTSLGLCAAMHLVAASWLEAGSADGSIQEARLMNILTILADSDSRVHVLDFDKDKKATALRMMEADGTVSTVTMLHSDLFPGSIHNMAALANGQLAFCTEEPLGGGDDDTVVSVIVVIGGDISFAPSSEALAGLRPLSPPADAAARKALPNLLAVPISGGEGSEGGSNSSSSGAASPFVTVRVGGGHKAFVAHRSVLAARSEYFKTQLAEGGGFGDSGVAEVNLEGAHPDAFGHLLSYAYTGIVAVPDELLRPAAELAGRLLLPADCIVQLTARLLTAATPMTAVSDLVWAVQHGKMELVTGLKAYLLRHRKAVAAAGAQAKEGLVALAGLDPELAAELLMMAFVA